MFFYESFLILLGFAAGILLTYLVLKERIRTQFLKWQTEFEDKIRKDALKRSRSVLKGKIGEHFAPFLPEFKFEPADARFLGNPIDYLVFEGYSKLSKGGKIEQIVLIDVKTGKTQALSSTERKIKDAVEAGRVKWETIRLDDGVELR